MEGEVGAQVATAVFLHPGRFESPLGKKRDLPWQSPSYCHPHPYPHLPPAALQNSRMDPGLPAPATTNWNQRMWDWDSVGFVARPSSDASPDALSVGAREVELRKKGEEALKGVGSRRGLDADGETENLSLKLGGVAYSAAVEEPVSRRPSKRVRSGSPGYAGGGGGGGGSYPMCQVDDCRADLTGAKDYHRRHKVCEVHSKMTKALVGKVMQRFCQQCSRFHPLSEFDEGKRSCRRRLAGHNRRRRKTQADDVSSRTVLSGNQEKSANGNMDIVNLLTILAHLQGKAASKPPNNIPALNDRDHLIQFLSKLHSSPAANSSSRAPGGFDLNVSQVSHQGSFEQLPKTYGNPNAPSTTDLLAVLSAALGASSPNNLVALLQGGSDSSGDDKTKIMCVDPVADVNSLNHSSPMLPSVGAGRSSCTDQSVSEERSMQEAQVRLSLELFSSADDDSPPKFGSSVKYLSSESSNPMEDRSLPCSPPVTQELFPVHAAVETRYDRMLICREDNPAAEASTSCGWSRPLDLFKGAERRVANGILQNQQCPAGYISSSGSDHSPSSSNSDAQNRTDRIIFKLFDKDPSNLPASLRTQILSWLSNSPSEMESYIRPGCIVLSIYVSMPSIAWDELEEELLQRVTSLIHCSDSDFWTNGRFLVRTSRQLASHKGGKIRLCKSWRTWSAPELTCVSPVAIVSGKETSLVLRGRNLTVPGTKIHCTYMGGYSSKEVLGSTYPGTIYDHSSSESFIFPGLPSDVFGRCFIEVENGFKGNSFPVIIADASICQELRALESELEEDVGSTDAPEDQVQDNVCPRSREDVLHFLNELGWLFQKKKSCSVLPAMDFSCTQFKFLLTFSVERDWPVLIRTLLDILVERSLNNEALSRESVDMLSEVQLLSRAVKRRCSKMVDLLLHYSVRGASESSNIYLFPPNLVGPGGLTPLHLAACTQDSLEMVDALTNDPQEVGLNCWTSVQDDTGQSPYVYASVRDYHSYNRLVARKLADRRNGQVSIMVVNEHLASDKPCITGEQGKPRALSLETKSCARCALEAHRYKPVARTRGLLQRPYVHSILAIAAVCVCVCLFFRGMPKVGSIAPFKWENLDFGPS